VLHRFFVCGFGRRVAGPLITICMIRAGIPIYNRSQWLARITKKKVGVPFMVRLFYIYTLVP
jgi:hypothetical protein